MSWLTRYRVRHFLANSIWIFPLFGMLAAIALIRVIYWVDRDWGWHSPMDADTARAMLATMASAMFTLVVFVSSALLVVVQLASAQLTPRIIGILFRSPVMKGALTLFVFTFTFTVADLIRVSNSVPSLTTSVAMYGCVISIAVFLYLIDHVGRSLRPSGALRSVVVLGRRVIKAVYPHRIEEQVPRTDSAVQGLLSETPMLEVTCHKDGVVLAFDVKGLLLLATRHDCVIELIPQVGDHIAAGDPLFRVFGGRTMLSPDHLRHSVALGMERTLEQDPTFAFRIMVDIASKGLSPAINDPTTAVLAIDQIQYLLRYVGMRNLDTGVVLDSAGRVRLIYRTPDWEDFVRLAVTEIRHFGGESIQVTRRLRAMLDNLVKKLPEPRRELLRQELTLLHRSAEKCFLDPADLALAEVSDAQGVGGKRERH